MACSRWQLKARAKREKRSVSRPESNPVMSGLARYEYTYEGAPAGIAGRVVQSLQFQRTKRLSLVYGICEAEAPAHVVCTANRISGRKSTAELFRRLACGGAARQQAALELAVLPDFCALSLLRERQRVSEDVRLCGAQGRAARANGVREFGYKPVRGVLPVVKE